MATISNSTKYKLVILGEGGVGKSALCVQFMQNHFITEYDPTIENSYQKTIVVDGETCHVDLLDTAGQEEYAVMRNQYIQAGQGFVLVYSIIQKTTFDTMKDFYDQIVAVKSNVPIILLGNKCDLVTQRKVPKEDGSALAAKMGSMPFFETSAKDRTNVEESFTALLQLMIDHRKASTTKNTNNGQNTSTSTRNCCVLF